MHLFPLFLQLLMPALMQIYGITGYDRVILRLLLISSLTVIIPLTLGALGWKRLDKGLRYFVILLLLVLLTELTAFFGLSAFKIPNLLVYNIFTGAEYLFLILMFTSWLDSRILNRILLGSIPIFLVIWVAVNYAFENSPQKFDTLLLSIESVFFVILSVLALVKEMRDSSVLLVDNPVFWIASGVLVYFAGNLVVFALLEQVLQEGVTRYHSAWFTHTALNVIKNILFSLGFLATGGPKERLLLIRAKRREKKAAAG